MRFSTPQDGQVTMTGDGIRFSPVGISAGLETNSLFFLIIIQVKGFSATAENPCFFLSVRVLFCKSTF
jgi:hypothetical protein